MAEKTGSFDSSGTAEQAAEFAKRIQEMMANYFDCIQNSTSVWGGANLSGRLMNRATKQASTASAFVSKLSQAADLQDVVKIQIEFAQTQMNLFNERTKEIGDAVAAATNLLGAMVSLLNWKKVLEDLARNAPAYVQTGEKEGRRTWSAGPAQEQHRTEDRSTGDRR